MLHENKYRTFYGFCKWSQDRLQKGLLVFRSLG